MPDFDKFEFRALTCLSHRVGALQIFIIIIYTVLTDILQIEFGTEKAEIVLVHLKQAWKWKLRVRVKRTLKQTEFWTTASIYAILSLKTSYNLCVCECGYAPRKLIFFGIKLKGL